MHIRLVDQFGLLNRPLARQICLHYVRLHGDVESALFAFGADLSSDLWHDGWADIAAIVHVAMAVAIDTLQFSIGRESRDLMARLMYRLFPYYEPKNSCSELEFRMQSGVCEPLLSELYAI